MISSSVIKGHGIKSGISSKQKITGNISKAENIYVTELIFSNHFEFPAIGEENKLYIAKDENAIYRFNKADNIYICLSRDYTEINIIQGI